MELALEIQDLISNLPNLPYHRLGFATSLINQFTRKGTLSPNQAPWVGKLIDIATGKAPQTPQPVTVGDLSGLIALFKTAALKLKWPKIRLQVGNTAIVLSVAGERSKAPGSINVAGAGGFGSRDWYGRISPEGTFDPSRGLTAEFSAALVPVLQELANDPLAAVKRYGTLTGNCMFCSLPLTDKRSKATGCGETCAKNFGLHAQWKAAK